MDLECVHLGGGGMEEGREKGRDEGRRRRRSEKTTQWEMESRFVGLLYSAKGKGKEGNQWTAVAS